MAFATPNIGNAGTESAQVAPTTADTSNIPTTFANVAKAAPQVLQGAYGIGAFAESRVLKSQAEELSSEVDKQIQQGFNQDVPAQSSVQTLGNLKEAVTQGQMSMSSFLLRGQALKDKAKGLSPVYGAEIDEVFAKNGIDPTGRNAVGLEKYNFQVKDNENKIKTVQDWYRDPKMAQYIVFQPGVETTEDNINVKATLDNVYKVNKALTDTAQGASSAISSSFAAINSQFSNQLTQLQQSTGDPAEIAAQQQAVLSSGQNQFKQLISYAIQQQSKFPAGSDQWKAIDSQISAIRAAENDFKTLDPQQLVKLQTTAKMVASQTSIVSGTDEINYVQSGMKGLERLGQLNATGVIPVDAAGFDVINQMIKNNQPLNPIQQTVYNYAKSQPAFVNFLTTNLSQPNYTSMEPAAVNIAAQTDNNSSNNLFNILNTLDQQLKGQKVTKQEVSQLASNNARLWDGMANSSAFSKDPANYTSQVKNMASPQYTSKFLAELPSDQRSQTAKNGINIAYTALTSAGFPTSLQTMAKNDSPIVLDTRTDSVYFKNSKSDIGALNQLGLPSVTVNRVATEANSSLLTSANQTWNNALAAIQNLSPYDAALSGKSRIEIAQMILQQYGYPENLIEIKK